MPYRAITHNLWGYPFQQTDIICISTGKKIDRLTYVHKELQNRTVNRKSTPDLGLNTPWCLLLISKLSVNFLTVFKILKKKRYIYTVTEKKWKMKVTRKISSLSVRPLFSRPVMSDSLQAHGPRQARPPYSSPSPEVCPSSSPLYQWCHPTISSSDTLFFCPRSFPASGTFPMSQLFISDDQNTGVSVSASVLPTSIQGWFPLRQGFPYGSVAKESACNAGDPGSIPGSGRSSGEGIGYPLQYSWASLWLSW